MNLYYPMANTLSRYVSKVPELRDRVHTYFKTGGEGRWGFYPKQLRRKHHLIEPLSIKMSAFMNLWLETLPTLSVHPALTRRMTNCALSYAENMKFDLACKIRVCPLCRALASMHIDSLISSGTWARIDEQEVQVVEALPRVRTRPGASLTLRNVILKDGAFILKVLSLIPYSRTGNKIVNSAALKTCRNLLDYDFNVLSELVVEPWLMLTKGIRSFKESADFAGSSF